MPSTDDVHLTRDSEMGTPRFVRRRTAYLSEAAPGAKPEEIAAAFIEANGRTFTLTPSDIAPPNARITRNLHTKHNGMRSLTWQQEHSGLDVFGATFALNLDKENRIINVQSRALHIPSVRIHEVVKVGKKELERIIEKHFAQRRQDAESNEVQTSDLRPPTSIWYPLDQISVIKCWDLMVERGEYLPRKNAENAKKETHRLIIRGDTGEVVKDINLTWTLENATYNVYTDDSPEPMTPGPSTPTNGVAVEIPRTNATLMAVDTSASPLGWIPDGNDTLSGNNAQVYADWDDNDSPDGPAVTGITYRVFDYPLDFTTGSRDDYVEAAQVQAFYVINHFHDRLWQLGFDEAAGNFQSDNFGRGGVQGDRLRVEVQNDYTAREGGLYRINAWYSGWGDGSVGRIAVETSTIPPRRDGALDAQLLIHEAAHGLSTRLIGNGFGLSTTQSRGLGEGWSDFVALALLSESGDTLDGTYPVASYAGVRYGAQHLYFGVRRFPYSTNTNKAPQTLVDIDPNQIYFDPAIPRNPYYGSKDADQIHNIGEIWCLMLWECRNNLIERYGFAGNDLMMQLVVDGMKLSPTNPNFEEARDAILQADLVSNGGTNQIDLWRGFAKRGLGYDAVVPGSVGTAGIEESFVLPFEVEMTLAETTGDGDGYVEPGENGAITVVVTSHEMGISNATAILTTLSSNVTVTVSNAVVPAIAIGGSSTAAPPFAVSVAAPFPDSSNAWFVLTVESDQGSFEELLSLRIGNPYDYPPEISGVMIEPEVTNAAVSWETGIESVGAVRLGEGGTTNEHGWTPMGNDHSVMLDGLVSGSNYVCRIVAVGTNGLTNVTEELEFRTHSYVYVYADSVATQELGTLDAPFRSLQAGANAAKVTGDDIHVAWGTYTSEQTEAVLELDGSDWDLHVEGGYSPDFSDRDIDGYETIIDGERSRRGIWMDDGAKLSVDGLTITRGQGEWGGGVHVRQSDFEAYECVITDNSSTNVLNDFWGGVYGTLSSQVLLENSMISDNTALVGGAAFVVSDGTSLAVSQCLVSSNTATLSGGFEVLLSATVEMNGTELTSNRAETGGGGVRIAPFCSAHVTHSTITYNENTAASSALHDGGGGILAGGNEVTIVLVDSVLHGNQSAYGSDLRCDDLGTEVYATHCNIGDIYGTLNASNNVINADPLFASPEAGDFHLLYGSPCIDAGSTNAGASTDMDGEPRPFGLAMDMGADEFVDGDGDNMADYWEQREYGGTNTTDGMEDTDGDSLNTFGEYMAQTDPHDADTDDDLALDGWEVANSYDPLDRDMDDDQMWDGWEFNVSLNAFSNDAALNPDGDTHDNLGEFAADTDPHDSNSILTILNLGEEWGGTRIDWKGGIDSWQWLEYNTNLLSADGWSWIAGFPPPTPEVNAVVVFGLTNSPTFYRIRAERE